MMSVTNRDKSQRRSRTQNKAEGTTGRDHGAGATITARWPSVRSWPGSPPSLRGSHHRAGSFQSLPDTHPPPELTAGGQVPSAGYVPADPGSQVLNREAENERLPRGARCPGAWQGASPAFC